MNIYKITCKLNGMGYLGKTTRSLEERIKEHLRNSRNSYVDRAIKKYGWKNFTVEVLAVCKTIEELNECERKSIVEYKTKFPNGYNLTDGGEGTAGRIVSDETRKKYPKHAQDANFSLLAKNIAKKFHLQTKESNVLKNIAEIFPRDNAAPKESHIRKKHAASCRQSVKINAPYVVSRLMKLLNL